MKFKYFYNSSGIASEKEINTWLKANSNIKIIYMCGRYDQVYILYEDKKKVKIIKEKCNG